MADFVREVMTHHVVVVPPDASLVEAAQLMRAQDIGDVLVASDRHVLGVLTDRDIALRAVADGADPLTVSTRAVCTPNPVVVGPEDSVSVAAGLMRKHAVRRRPVVDDGRLVGMVSMGDIAVALDPRSPLAEISQADGRAPRGIDAVGAQRSDPRSSAW
jgi:CBS domain-containing protein